MNKWSDINKFRNNIVAHPWRDEGTLVVPLNKQYKIPRTWIEFRFLKDLISYIHSTIKSEFQVEMGEALFYGNQLSENVSPTLTVAQINNDIAILAENVNKIMNSHSKDYEIKLYTYS